MTTTPVELISRYQALAPMEQAIVRLLSLNIGPMTQLEISSCLEILDFKNRVKWYPTRKEVTAALSRLEEKQLTIKKKGSASHHPSLRIPVLLDLLNKGLFAAFQSCIAHLDKQKKPHWRDSFFSLDQSMRILQQQLFSNASLDILNSTISNIYREYGHALTAPPLIHLFGFPFPLPILQHCTHAQAIGSHLLADHFNNLVPYPELASYLIAQCQDKSFQFSPLILYQYLFMTGKTEQARQLLHLPWPDRYSTDHTCAQACSLFLQGQYQQSCQLFNEVLIQFKKNTGKRKIALHGLPGIFHLCSLLATDDPAHLKIGSTLLDTAGKQQLLPEFLLQNFTNIFAQRQGLPLQKLPLNSSPGPLYSPLHFFSLLSLWWMDQDQGLEIIPAPCGQLLALAQKHRFFWLAAECASLLAGLGIDAEINREQSRTLHHQCQTVSCVPIIQPVDKSMQRLQALLALTRTNEAESADNITTSQRMVWWLSHDQDNMSYTLSPILQKLSKNGRWSKGRSVSIKTLYENFTTMAGLSDQDQQICRTIERVANPYYYHTETYQLNMDRALIATVGHPAIFLADNPQVQIDLGRGEMELRITRNDDAITLQLWPTPPKQSASTFLHRETPTSFKVYQIRPNQKNLLHLLTNQLTLPANTIEQIRGLAASLSTMVTVHSDVGGSQEVEEVVSDPRPHLHLLPFQDGLRAEILIRPISSGGSWLRPGQGGAVVFGKQEGKQVQARRDLAQESELRDQLLTACPILAHTEEVDGQFLFPEPAESLELLCQLRQFPDCTLHWPKGQTFSLRAETGFANLSLHIKKDRDWFAASGSLQVDGETVLGLQKLLGLLDQAKGRFIPLEDGSFLALTKALQKRLEEFRAYSEKTEKGKEGIRFNPLAALALDDLTSEASVDGDRQWQAHKKRLAEVVQPPVPSTFTATLRDYQIQGFSWLAQLSHWQMGACLADDMGLGKTIQALAAILLRAPLGPTLVVAPLSVAGNWEEEAGRFAPTLQVKIFGQGDRQEMLDTLGPFDLLISSYGLLQIEGERLAGVAWQTVVLDEAQAIKNRQTKRAKAAMALNAEFRIITTGTPLENHLGELWALFHFINPGLLGTHQRFTETFAIPIERDKDRNRLQQLQRLIHPFILRRMKNEVLQELPAKTEITLKVEMSTQEAALYEAQRRTALAKLEGDGQGRPHAMGAGDSGDDASGGKGQGDAQHLQILAEIMKLRRLCCNPALVLPEAGIESSKLKVFADILAEMLENRHKALVFSQFIDHLAIIRALLDKRKIPYQYLDGSTSAAQRKERIAAFQAGAGEVFLISLKAGGSGLNLTAADYVIHMDPWWNPAVEDQASDRAHRIGQERPVTVYRLVMKGSIEEQIVGLHKDKRDLADSLLDGADIAGKLNASELLALLRDSGREIRDR